MYELYIEKESVPHNYPVYALPTSERGKTCDGVRSSGAAGSLPLFRFVSALCLDDNVAPKTGVSSSKQTKGIPAGQKNSIRGIISMQQDKCSEFPSSHGNIAFDYHYAHQRPSRL